MRRKENSIYNYSPLENIFIIIITHTLISTCIYFLSEILFTISFNFDLYFNLKITFNSK